VACDITDQRLNVVIGQSYAASELAATSGFLGLGDQPAKGRAATSGEHIADLFRAVKLDHPITISSLDDIVARVVMAWPCVACILKAQICAYSPSVQPSIWTTRYKRTRKFHGQGVDRTSRR
jgi:hypothetical protein